MDLERIYWSAIALASWLERYGEESWDHQSFYAGRIGRAAKALYYSKARPGNSGSCTNGFLRSFYPIRAAIFLGKAAFSHSPMPTMPWGLPIYSA